MNTIRKLTNQNTSYLSRPGGGFTLIELLTVIAIIGILAAILVPVVGRVRISASKAVAISNFRQIGVAIQVFLAENNDRLPGPGLGGGQPSYARDARHLVHPRWLGTYIDSASVTLGGQQRWHSELMESPRYISQRPATDSTPALRATSIQAYRRTVHPFGYEDGNESIDSMTIDSLEAAFPLSQRWMLIEISSDRSLLGVDGNWPWPVAEGPLHGNGSVALMFAGNVEFLQPNDERLTQQAR